MVKVIQRLKAQSLVGNVLMMVVVCFWGTSFVSIKTVLIEIPPVTMAVIRFGLATLILFPVLWKLEPGVRPRRSDIRRLVIAGFLGISLYYYFENTGMRLTTASNASLITALIPILATTLDIIVYKSKLTLLQGTGMLLALIGAYLAITANGEVGAAAASLKGNLLIVSAAICWTFYTLYAKSLQRSYSGLFLTAWQNLTGTLLLLPISLAEHAQWQPVSGKTVIHLLYLTVFCSAACYLLYNYALKRLDVAATTVYLNVVPVIGVLAGYLFLRETVLPIQIAGGVIIMLGVIVVNMKGRGKPKAELVNAA